jgi:hypothetical protein
MCRVDWQDHELRNVWTALERDVATRMIDLITDDRDGDYRVKVSLVAPSFIMRS